jgi:hypothetical protein
MSQSDTPSADLSRGGTKQPVFPALAMSRPGDGPSQPAWKRRPRHFPFWNNPRWGFFLLFVFAANILVATLAWVIVRLITS